MQTDPIADMLTRVRNASRAKHPRVDVPASKLKIEIARILKEEGFIATYKVADENRVKKTLRIFLKYTPDRHAVLVPRQGELDRLVRPGEVVEVEEAREGALTGMGELVLRGRFETGVPMTRRVDRRGVGHAERVSLSDVASCA